MDCWIEGVWIVGAGAGVGVGVGVGAVVRVRVVWCGVVGVTLYI